MVLGRPFLYRVLIVCQMEFAKLDVDFTWLPSSGISKRVVWRFSLWFEGSPPKTPVCEPRAGLSGYRIVNTPFSSLGGPASKCALVICLGVGCWAFACCVAMFVFLCTGPQTNLESTTNPFLRQDNCGTSSQVPCWSVGGMIQILPIHPT